MDNHIEVFYAYAPADETWVQELEKHLSLLQRQGFISTWHPRLIVAGEDWQHITNIHFQKASIILLLISPDFLASDYCYGHEMKQALEHEKERGVCIIPILLRPVDWQSAPFAHLRPLPSDATFLTESANLDRAFAEITSGIRNVIENLSLITLGLVQTDYPQIWNVPFPQNLFFIGREELLTHLHTQFHTKRTSTLSQAISGLGGIGKTQLAVEYAYRFHQNYQAVLWAHAESTEALISSYLEIATLLNLPVKDSQEQAITVNAVKIWLQNHRNWLLILDNADELDILPAFLPPRLGGHVIITTRAAATGRFALRLLVDTFSLENGILFLLRRAGIITLDADVSQASSHNQMLAKQIAQEVGGLPLALDQIGAYLETTGCGLAAYWQLYQQYCVKLLKEYKGLATDYAQTVATTWSLSFARVEERNPTAVNLLYLCSFLAPDTIREDMLIQGAGTLAPTLAAVVTDSYQLDKVIDTLRAYSLIKRNAHNKSLAIHRLVQTVIRDTLPANEQLQWIQYTIALVNQAFPNIEFKYWLECEYCLPHAYLCAQWIQLKNIASPEATRLLDHLGYYLSIRGHYFEAEPFLQQALSIREHQLGHQHLDTAVSLRHLAQLYQFQGKYTQTEPLLQKALFIREQQLGPEHSDTADSLYDLALLYQFQGKYAQSEQLYQQTLSIREHQLGLDHLDIAIIIAGLGQLYERWGRYTQAESLALRALVIYESQLGPNHPNTANILHNIALLYRRQGKYTHAEPLALRALAIREQQLGHEHPEVANSLSNLAGLYLLQGKYEQVEPLVMRELTIREKQLGDEHPACAFSLSMLVKIYLSQEQYTKAEPLALRELAIRDQYLGHDHHYTALSLDDLALLYTHQGKYTEAENLYQRAISICEHQLGYEHPDTAMILHDLAYLYIKQNKYIEAENVYQKSLVVRERYLGYEHPITAHTVYELANLYTYQMRYEEAESLYQRALTIFMQQLGPEHPRTQAAQKSYILLSQYKKQGNI